MGERVFVDANVLFSRTLRDKRPDLPGKVVSDLRTLVIANLDELVDDFVVEPWIKQGDVDDAHVRAAAQARGFDMLLTADRGLLVEREMASPALYETISPDEFFVLLDDSSPDLVRTVVKEEMSYFVKRNGDADLPGRLRAAGCPEFAKRVNGHCHALMP
ncbi:hypothetical protein LGT39_08340 [Demequina sp. TTPB684]|uniref:hypothetical protein n=1 Tax=unclassified Demequina TaxID=2620311 RepID=UPI001CF4FBF4|nr:MULTISPECIES: hypothetical protein [unclassified Demequina]MCB2412853.1 hypothetical protein [Demequina sp. TTPB684]UPU88170.1 hypothetical protein LGT36_013120 [Demequina sp. TMPB413]